MRWERDVTEYSDSIKILLLPHIPFNSERAQRNKEEKNLCRCCRVDDFSSLWYYYTAWACELHLQSTPHKLGHKQHTKPEQTNDENQKNSTRRSARFLVFFTLLSLSLALSPWSSSSSSSCGQTLMEIRRREPTIWWDIFLFLCLSWFECAVGRARRESNVYWGLDWWLETH